MIDEDVLTRLVVEAGEAAPEPARSPVEVVDALGREAMPEAPKRRVRILGVAAAVVVAGTLVVVVSGAASRSTDTSAAFRRSSGDSQTTATAVTADSGRSQAASIANSDALARATAGGTPTGAMSSPVSVQGAGGAQVQPPMSSPDSARVVKTGSVALEVEKGAFGATVERIVAMTTGRGGYVSESTTNESGDVPHGSVTLRVPAGTFDQVLTDLRGLGDVDELVSKGTDVMSQFTDLAARLAALTATRERLLTVLADANTVADIIAVQDRITGVQTEIERIQGQQRQLDDQAGFGTIAVTLAEPGVALRSSEDEPRTGLAAAWADARARFGDGIEGIVAWSGSAAVVALVGLVVVGLGRVFWVSVRRRLV